MFLVFYRKYISGIKTYYLIYVNLYSYSSVNIHNSIKEKLICDLLTSSNQIINSEQ